MAGTSAERELASSGKATNLVFASMGFAFASWASRIPQVKASLGLDASRLGLLLVALAVGSITALPLAGPLVARYGSRKIVRSAALLAGIGLIIVAIGSRVSAVPVDCGLFALGLATGTWDVGMNVQGAVIERRSGRSMLARFHGWFSLGTVVGALTGAGMVWLGVSVTLHLILVACLVGATVPTAARRFIPDVLPGPEIQLAPVSARRRSLAAWRERRTLLIGGFVIAFALAEGTGNDWIGVGMIQGHHARAAVATLAYGTFLAAMTVGRWFGPSLLDRHGRVVVLRALTIVAITGLALFILAPSIPVAFAGVLLWGAGTSLGFPVGMSAGADQLTHAAPRVGVITSIGYLGFLGGPPLIGLLAQQVTVLHALSAVVVVLIPAAAIAGILQPPKLRVWSAAC